MRNPLNIGMVVALSLAWSAPYAFAVDKKDQTPPRASKQGMEHKSPIARHKGANDPGFCPPGQSRKTR